MANVAKVKSVTVIKPGTTMQNNQTGLAGAFAAGLSALNKTTSTPTATTTSKTSGTSSSSATKSAVSTPSSSSLNVAEIKRKAEAGIPLTNPTQEALQLYQQYQAAAASKPAAVASGNDPKVVQSNMISLGQAIGQALAKKSDPQPVQQSAPVQPVIGAVTAERPSGYVPTYTGPNLDEMRAQLEAIFTNRQSSELAALRAALETALAGYAAQERQAQQLAYNQRNAADVVAAQEQTAMRELLANLGMTGDGQNLTAQAAQAAARLQAIGAINQQEAEALMRIAEQRSALKNSAAQQEVALIQAIGADKAAALYDLLKYGDTRAFEMDQINYGRYRDTIEDQFRRDALDWQRQMDLANLLGVYNGQQTLAGRQAALAERQANLDAALAVGAATGRLVSPQGDWSGLFRQAVNPNTPLNLTGQQFQLDRDQLIAALTGRLPDGSLTVSEQQRLFENDLALREFENLLAQQRFENDLARRKFEEDVRQFGLQYALNKARLEADRSAPQVTQSGLNQIIDNINTMYTQYNSQTGMRTVTNPTAVRTYILALNLSDDLTDQLLTYYGLPTR